MTLCVYAIASRPARPPAAIGLAGERLQIVSEGPIAAIAGELSRPPRPSARHLQRYDAAVQNLAAHLPSVLPARFGTCVESRDELAFVLRSRRRSLQRALAHVRNRVQMTIRIVDGGSAARNSDAGSPSREPEAGPGAAYLRARADAAARARQVPGFEPVRDAVQRWVRDERVERHAGVTTVYHLVPRASVEAYRRAAARAASQTDVNLILTGPWPAYAFAQV